MGGKHERDGEMTQKEEEKVRSSECSRASTRVDQAHGSAPVLISITLMAQTYIVPPRNLLRACFFTNDTQFLSHRSDIFGHGLIRFSMQMFYTLSS